jgi:opacity protein-like surface antigen
MKMMSGTRRSTGVLIVAIATVGEFAHAETTMSAYLGKSWTRSSDLTISQPATSSDATFQDVGWDSKSFSSPLYYGLRVTHFIEPYPSWGVAVDFTHYKIYARTSDAVRVHGRWNGSPVDETAPLETRVQKFNISHGVNYIGLLGLYRFRLEVTDAFPYGRLQPYVGIGPIYYIDHPESTVNSLMSERYQSSGWGYQVVGGMRYAFTDRWSLFGEVKYDQGRANASVAGDGSANLSLRTGHAVFGVNYTF